MRSTCDEELEATVAALEIANYMNEQLLDQQELLLAEVAWLEDKVAMADERRARLEALIWGFINEFENTATQNEGWLRANEYVDRFRAAFPSP